MLKIREFHGCSTLWRSAIIAGKYLAKYASKDLADAGKGRHRYRRSLGIKTPKEVLLIPHDVALDAELMAQFEARGAKVRFHKNKLTQEGAKWLWACSW